MTTQAEPKDLSSMTREQITLHNFEQETAAMLLTLLALRDANIIGKRGQVEVSLIRPLLGLLTSDMGKPSTIYCEDSDTTTRCDTYDINAVIAKVQSAISYDDESPTT